MRNTSVASAAVSLLLLAGTANAADHLFTGVGAGGLTTSSQPFLNGTNNPGRSGFTVPGQGSPLSGQDRTTPAVETGQLLTHHFSQPNLNANPGRHSAHSGGHDRADGWWATLVELKPECTERSNGMATAIR